MSRKPSFEQMHAAARLASSLGLAAAARQLGISPSRLCEWRKEVEAITGEKMPRKYHLRAYRGQTKLTLPAVAEIRRRRLAGASWGQLALRFKVSPMTARWAVRDVWKGKGGETGNLRRGDATSKAA